MEKQETRNETYAKTLAKMIQAETVSSVEEKNLEKFQEFHNLLEQLFPRLFETVNVEQFGGSLLLRWNGKDSSREPVLLMSHHDTVEASGSWTHPPFSGAIADGRIWGRGTLDTKGSLFRVRVRRGDRGPWGGCHLEGPEKAGNPLSAHTG